MKKKIKKRRSVNKSQLEMNVQPIYEQLKKKKKTEKIINMDSSKR